MRTADEIANEAIGKIAAFQGNNEIISRMTAIIEDLKSRPVESWGLDELVDKIGELSVLKVNLGEIVAVATLEYNAAYIFRKFKLASEYKALRAHVRTNKDAEEGALEKVEADYGNEVQKQYQADVFKAFHEDCNTLIMTLQTIINAKKAERSSGKYQQ